MSIAGIFVTSKYKELGIRNVVDFGLGSNLIIVVVVWQWDYVLSNVGRVNLGPSVSVFYQTSVTPLLPFKAAVLVECRLGKSEEFGTIT